MRKRLCCLRYCRKCRVHRGEYKLGEKVLFCHECGTKLVEHYVYP